MRKEIGRIVDDVEGRDIGHDQEDMQGIYTTGIEEIVGNARSKANARAATNAKRTGGKAAARSGRPAGYPAMPRQRVPGVPAPKPRVEIIQMPEMHIYAGPVNPNLAKLDPSTQMLLSMIRTDGKTRVDAAPVQRQRPVWPGSRGKYPY